MGRPQFVLFGDSITQYSFDVRGWGSLLAHSYQRKVDVINRGYSGYNTRWALEGMQKIFPPANASPPLLVTVFFGANDAALPDRSSARQHVPVKEYEENLTTMLGHLRHIGVQNMLFLTPPPIFEQDRVVSNQQRAGGEFPGSEVAERTNDVAGVYAEACKKVGAKEKVPVVDLWSSFQERPEWQRKLLCDGLHLSEEGNVLVFELLQQTINRSFPHLRPEELPLDLPLHSDIEDKNFRAAFQSAP